MKMDMYRHQVEYNVPVVMEAANAGVVAVQDWE